MHCISLNQDVNTLLQKICHTQRGSQILKSHKNFTIFILFAGLRNLLCIPDGIQIHVLSIILSAFCSNTDSKGQAAHVFLPPFQQKINLIKRETLKHNYNALIRP